MTATDLSPKPGLICFPQVAGLCAKTELVPNAVPTWGGFTQFVVKSPICLTDLGPDQAETRETRWINGVRTTYRLYRVTIRGFLGWTHARQLVRVERMVEAKNGDVPAVALRIA